MKEIDEAVEAIEQICADREWAKQDYMLIRRELERVAKTARREALDAAGRRVGTLYSALRLMAEEGT